MDKMLGFHSVFSDLLEIFGKNMKNGGFHGISLEITGFHWISTGNPRLEQLGWVVQGFVWLFVRLIGMIQMLH